METKKQAEQDEILVEEIEDRQFKWAEEHGAYQDENGEWQI